ncbi:MAG: SDR family oxidoreductase [Sphingomonadales bacterium]|nr:MAG: SDR family oxidoreductase [Sphingomonadales bacterium]
MSTTPNPLDFTGKVAIVTGGTRGLGRMIVQTLLEAGCTVETCGRTAPETLPAANGREARFSALDVRDPEAVSAFVAQVGERHGRLDILVNNAGGSPQADAATASPRFSSAIIALNLLAPLYMAQAAHPLLVAAPDGGSIINIASVSGVRPSPGTAAYGAAKAGLINLGESLAQEWGPHIRVNSVVLGLMETETSGETYGSDESRAQIADTLPLRRFGTGTDVAQAVLFLASPMASYISGAQIAVTGGGERPVFLDLR